MSTIYLKLKSTLIIGGASMRNQRIMPPHNVAVLSGLLALPTMYPSVDNALYISNRRRRENC